MQIFNKSDAIIKVIIRTAKRMRYTVKLKLAAIKHAQENNNCPVAREFGENEKLI